MVSVLLSLISLTAFPDEARFGPISLAEGISIPRGESRRFVFDAPGKEEVIVTLTAVCRIDAMNRIGSTDVLTIRINDHEVDPVVDRWNLRMLNKPTFAPVAPGLRASWYGPGGWRLPYAPDFATEPGKTFYLGDPYTLSLDVTNLIDRKSRNEVVLENSLSASVAARAKIEGTLVLDRLSVGFAPGLSRTLPRETPTTPEPKVGKPPAGMPDFKAEITPGGGLVLTLGGQRYGFSSRFSYPNAGWNSLEPSSRMDRTGQDNWRVLPPTSDSTSQECLAEGPNYKIHRTIRRGLHKIEVADAITNLQNSAPLGLIVRHELNLEGLAQPEIRIAGNSAPTIIDYYSPGNPSVHVSIHDSAIGLLCEDDVFRNQARLYFRGADQSETPVVGLRTEMLRLPSKQTYTLRWSIYPLKTAEYFDFINLVREDWNSNETVQGAWVCGYDPDVILATNDRYLRAQFERLGIRVVVLGGGWIDRKRDPRRIGFGAGVLDDYWRDYRRRIAQSAEKIRHAVPGTKVLGYYNSQRDTSDAGSELFRESRLTDAGGKPVTTDWGGKLSLTYSQVATLDNRFGKAMLDVADRYLQELKLDGLYWDEMEVTGFGSPLITYNASDGHSCLIDPKSYTITRDVGLTTLLGERHRLAVVDLVRSKGGLILSNGPTCTRALLAARLQHMIEIQHNDFWAFEGNLQTPLGYMGRRKDSGNVVRALNLATLPAGCSYDYTYDLPRYLFPFTPIELHAGYLLGKERIVTNRTGEFGWPGDCALVKVHHFDGDGKRTGTDHPTLIDREARTQVKLLENEIVVLERLPVAITPQRGKAVITQVRSSGTELSFHITVDQGSRIRITDRNLQVTKSTDARVLIDGQVMPFVISNGAISLNISGSHEVRVQRISTVPSLPNP